MKHGWMIKRFITSKDNLWTNFNVFNNPSVFLYTVYASLMLSASLKMIKIDGNMSQF